MILLPTLNRPNLLKRFFESYVETKATVQVAVLADDLDLVQYDVELPPNCSYVNTGKAVSMGDKVRSCWPAIRDLNPKWIGLLNDDHYCITPEWDKKVEALLDGFGY